MIKPCNSCAHYLPYTRTEKGQKKVTGMGACSVQSVFTDPLPESLADVDTSELRFAPRNERANVVVVQGGLAKPACVHGREK